MKPKLFIVILLIINSVLSEIQNDDNIDIKKMFPNMPLIEEYHNNKERAVPYSQEEQAEYIWMFKKFIDIEKGHKLTASELNRFWDNFKTGSLKQKSYSFPVITHLEPVEKWIQDFKELCDSKDSQDRLIAYSAIERNLNNSEKIEEILSQEEAVNLIRNLPEFIENKRVNINSE